MQSLNAMGCQLSNLQSSRKLSHHRAEVDKVPSSVLEIAKSYTTRNGILLSLSRRYTISRDSDFFEPNTNITHPICIKRNSFTRRKTAADLTAIISSKACMHDIFTEFEKDVLVSTWAVLSQELLQHGLPIFNLATEILPELESIFGIQ